MTPLHHDLQAVWDRYVAAYIRRDAKGCADVFTPDGAVYSPYGPPALNRAEIEAQHVEWVQLGGSAKTLIIETCGGSGDLAWCLARYSEGEASGNGTSMAVFNRQPDGGWLVRMCSLNSSD